MTRGIAKQNLPVVGVFFGLLAASLGGLVLLPPIPQDQSYHQFADQRTIFGIPNFWNVVSNLPFLVAGAAGGSRVPYQAVNVRFLPGAFPLRSVHRACLTPRHNPPLSLLPRSAPLLLRPVL